MPERRRLNFAPSALSDLERIWVGIAEDNPGAADRSVTGILEATDRLREFPELCARASHLIFGR